MDKSHKYQFKKPDATLYIICFHSHEIQELVKLMYGDTSQNNDYLGEKILKKLN